MTCEPNGFTGFGFCTLIVLIRLSPRVGASNRHIDR
jgi:hypothetical protein